MHHDVIADLCFGDKIQADLIDDSAEFDAASVQAIFFRNVEDLTGNLPGT